MEKVKTERQEAMLKKLMTYAKEKRWHFKISLVYMFLSTLARMSAFAIFKHQGLKHSHIFAYTALGEVRKDLAQKLADLEKDFTAPLLKTGEAMITNSRPRIEYRSVNFIMTLPQGYETRVGDSDKICGSHRLYG